MGDDQFGGQPEPASQLNGVLDTFALDIYAGYGFSPVGFDQTVTFALQTIF
jgi:hypothetical protein